MSETTLLLSGAFCFGLTLLGVVLTVIEFRKGSQAAPQPGEATTSHETATVYKFRRAA